MVCAYRETETKTVGLSDGDATKGALYKQELEKRAKDEGWVLKPKAT